MSQIYSEDSIRVLKGLEPVKERPGMYTRTESPLHIIQEVIDNAADEALGGFGHTIDVTLHADGMVSVEDDGRGIPIGIHPEEGVPVIEIVFTRLHAGGKFNKKDGGAYAFSGGLHGVGVSVTNALSTHLGVTVWRDKQVANLVFSGGDVVRPLEVREASRGDKKNGTRVTVAPDPKYFDSPNIPQAELERVLRAKAVLLPGVKVTLTNEKTGQKQTWFYEDGLQGYLRENLEEEPLIPYFSGEWFAPEGDDTFAKGEGAAWVLAWTAQGGLVRESYVNLIATPAGGTHEAGVREGVFSAVKSFIELHALLPKGVKLISDDVFARTSFVLSAKVLDPQFQGQTKERLNNRDAVKLVAQATRPALELWLNQHVDYGKLLAELVIAQAQARNKAAQKVEKRKSSGVAVLPGKLTDCESTDLLHNELFLVEGDSAGGSAKMGRNKEFQAILPLRGKVLNTLEVDKDRLFANNEVHDMAVAIGVDPHGPNDEPDLSGLRYGKICILSDADVDGSHIQVLLLTLFYKHFPKLIEQGNIYIARPPLFRVDVPARGKKLAQKVYCLDSEELNRVQDKLLQDGMKEGAWQVSRFKGLGEMNAEQLWETTMNPDTRRLSQVALNTERVADDGNSKIMMTMLMGKGEAASRRAWLEEKGNLVNADI
ncbi:DNA topoisomerase IV subunit B [Hydromonas duriensis]|uniref:DNA topoisomerase 4 subunit B n=1 Tax=Hydromonas duriensis TaxID=1527608 RepID=A0A4R6Y8R7_9BURK|nr:DNA topoisomerase IV subunit B [Hydromonas duriensis]TDR31829.1 DNA topoisomerase IV subunit B [Hydromonas duriensis]